MSNVTTYNEFSLSWIIFDITVRVTACVCSYNFFFIKPHYNEPCIEDVNIENASSDRLGLIGCRENHYDREPHMGSRTIVFFRICIILAVLEYVNWKLKEEEAYNSLTTDQKTMIF